MSVFMYKAFVFVIVTHFLLKKHGIYDKGSTF